MNPELWTLIGTAGLYALGTFAYFCARRSDYHRGKADAFRSVANDWSSLAHLAWMSDKKRQRRERKAGFLRMALCQHEVCDAMEDALIEARRYWKHPERDDLSPDPEKAQSAC